MENRVTVGQKQYCWAFTQKLATVKAFLQKQTQNQLLFDHLCESIQQVAHREIQKNYIQKTIIQLNTQNQDALLHLGKIFSLFNRSQQAGICFTKALQNNPTKSSFYHTLAQIVLKINMPEIITCYKSMVKDQPNILSLDQNITTAVLSEIKTRIKVECYRKIVQQEPQNQKILHELGTMLVGINMHQAVECFMKVIQNNNKHTQTYWRIVYLLILLDRCQEALYWLGKQAQYDSEIKQSLFSRQIIYEFEFLEVLFKKMIQKYGDKDFCAKIIEINAKQQKAFNRLGALLQHMKRFELAILCFQKAIEINPKFTHAHINLARLLTEMKRQQEASEHYKTAINIDSKIPQHKDYKQLGWYLQKKKKYNEGIFYWQKLLELNPYNYTAYGEIKLFQQLKNTK